MLFTQQQPPDFPRHLGAQHQKKKNLTLSHRAVCDPMNEPRTSLSIGTRKRPGQRYMKEYFCRAFHGRFNLQLQLFEEDTYSQPF